MILIADIQRAVAARHHISVKALIGQSRTPKVCRSRHMAMYLARRLTRQSYEAIGRRFGGRHHTSVLHGFRKVQDRAFRNRKTQAALAHMIDHLTASLAEGRMLGMQGILNHIADPAAKKILIMSWWERGAITPELAETLIRELGLEAA